MKNANTAAKKAAEPAIDGLTVTQIRAAVLASGSGGWERAGDAEILDRWREMPADQRAEALAAAAGRAGG